RRSDTEHHGDVAAINLNALDQKADQIPLKRPINRRQSIPNLAGKVFEPAHTQRQRRPLSRLVPQGLSLLFPPLDPLAEPGDPRLEVSLVDQALSIAIDQSPPAAAQLRAVGLES